MKNKKNHDILLINPWIYDFAAFDLWAKPIGLLYIASLLRKNGYRVHYIDCLDINTPDMENVTGIEPAKRKGYGTGRFYKENVAKPDCLKGIPKRYSRYGITPVIFLKELKRIPKPGVILVTSMMTYWYPGVFQVIDIIKDIYPEVPVILGGIYATLCYSHASEYSKADYIVRGEGEMEALKLVGELTGNRLEYPNPGDGLDVLPYPAFDLMPNLDYVCIMTSRGCPFSCTYCASHIVYKGFRRRIPLCVVDEMQFWREIYGVKEFAFYDDALMVEPEKNIKIILKEVLRRKILCNFHTPNGIHIRFMTKELCGLMHEAGFKTIRLGLETSDVKRQYSTGNKTTNREFEQSVSNLREAGFLSGDIGVYILIGLPGQKPEEVEDTIRFVWETGAKPILAEYSPIPQTALWENAVEEARFDIAGEPLFHNNSLVPFRSRYFSLETYNRLKQMTRKTV
ncbi:MAG: radical SAM protein [Thermodesulfobacteriota bacterium]